jgi:hypothetical protein
MKASVQTRIFLALTPDEARAAVNNATDVQLEIRSALYQIDGMPISQMIAPNPALLAASKNGHKKPRSKNRIHAPDKQCPHCGEMKHPTGYSRHVKACKAKHPDEADLQHVGLPAT